MSERKNKIIVVEGLWGTGKTTYAKKISKGCSFVFLKEPDHHLLKYKPKDIEMWYLKKFLSLEKKALRICEKRGVVMERSRISVLSYLFALNDTQRLNKFIIFLKNIDFRVDEIIFIRGDINKLIKVITNPNHRKFKKIPVLADNPNFVKRYNLYLKTNLRSMSKDNKVKEIKTDLHVYTYRSG